jgi:competence protein ComEA
MKRILQLLSAGICLFLLFPAAVISQERPSIASSAGSVEEVTEKKINVNTAMVEELEVLIGIGPVLARRIVDYRETNGSFQTIEDLLGVSGIGATKLDSLKDRIEAVPVE